MTLTTQGSDTTPGMVVPPRMSRLADHWGLVLTFGLMTIALGLALAVWPEATLKVLALLLAVQLIVTGVLRIVSAVASRQVDGGLRALLGLVGALGVLGGLLLLRAPLQTLTALGLLLGAWWVISGLIDLVAALVGGGQRGRGANLLMGLVSLVAGAYLVLNPEITLPALVVLCCVWLFGYGGIAVIAALQLRSVARSAPVP
jgi:uncharacterized membrane protein HdeD (DUF308 family)